MATTIFIESSGNLIATIEQVFRRGELNLALRKGVQYTGQISLNRIPPPLLEALGEYREIVDDNILSLVDEALMRVLEFDLTARVDPKGVTGRVTDFQLYDQNATVVIDFPSGTAT